jgi:AraC-like DNA-binding protein
MRRSTIEELARAPVSRYVAGDSFVHFCAAPHLWGVILWGRPDRDQAVELGRSLVLELAPPAVPHVSIFDASRLEGAEPAAFGAAGRYLADFGDALGRYVRRLALVRPAGMNGAIVSGAFEVLPRPFPVAVWDDAADAMEWLARDQDPERDASWPADGAALIAAIHAEAAAPPVLSALRAFLDDHLEGASLAAAARAIGVSERTLQRKLNASRTTFTDELSDARIRAAKRRLIDGDAPLTAIAFDVGCASLQHFSALFRRRVGESPSDYRRRNRRG